MPDSSDQTFEEQPRGKDHAEQRQGLFGAKRFAIHDSAQHSDEACDQDNPQHGDEIIVRVILFKFRGAAGPAASSAHQEAEFVFLGVREG
jgi:hypothetical protein